MTMRELQEAMAGIFATPTTGKYIEVAVEDERGELRELAYLEYESEFKTVVIHLGKVIDK